MLPFSETKILQKKLLVGYHLSALFQNKAWGIFDEMPLLLCCILTSLPGGVQSIVMSMSVCLSVSIHISQLESICLFSIVFG